MIPCGYEGSIKRYKGLTCDPENLVLIETIKFVGGIGSHEKIEKLECSSCKKIWLIKEIYDSHKGTMSICTLYKKE